MQPFLIEIIKGETLSRGKAELLSFERDSQRKKIIISILEECSFWIYIAHISAINNS